MPVTVKFSSEEECPCPLNKTLGDEKSAKAWEIARGKTVVLLALCPLEQVHPNHRCGSDTYWWVEEEGASALAAQINHSHHNMPILVCRHLLDIGD